MEVSSREWALVIWFGLIVVMLLLWPTGRRSAGEILGIVLGHRILVPFLSMVAYTGAVITTLVGLGVWDAKLITPTIVWFLTVAAVSFFRLNRAMTEHHYFRKLAFDAIAAPVAAQFLFDMYPFPLQTEIFLQGGFLLLGAMSAFAAISPEHRPVHHFLNVLIALMALAVAFHSIMEIIAQWSTIDFVSEAKKFALPIGMTAAFLPFMYCLALYAAYESALSRMGTFAPAGRSLVKPAIALALKTGLSVRRLAEVNQPTKNAMARASTVAEAKTLFDEGRATAAARQREAEAKQQRLIDNAGLKGADEDGKRLDHREFEETKAALSYLHLCFAGHYRNSGRYRNDMLEFLGAETLVKKGLPDGAVITLHVAVDGQQWWAWRRTVSGWVFAIGAIEAPNDRWEYDGPDVPSAGPGTDPSWRHFMVPAEPHQHW